jgi:hypothetical protein
MTGLQLKKEIELKLGYKAKCEWLLFRQGREIRDEDLLSDHNIMIYSTVFNITSFILVIYLFRFI